MFSIVLLPHPLGPMMLTNSPASAAKSTASSTWRGSPRPGKLLSTLSSAIPAGEEAAEACWG